MQQHKECAYPRSLNRANGTSVTHALKDIRQPGEGPTISLPLARSIYMNRTYKYRESHCGSFIFMATHFVTLTHQEAGSISSLLEHRQAYDLPANGLPRWHNRKESACQCRRCKRCGFDHWVGMIPWRREWQPPPLCLPGKFHGQKSLVGYSPGGCKESDMTEVTEHTLLLLKYSSNICR